MPRRIANVGVMAGVAVFVGVGVSVGSGVDVGGIGVSVGADVGETGAGLNVKEGSGAVTDAQDEAVSSAIRSSAKKIRFSFIRLYQCVCNAASIIC